MGGAKEGWKGMLRNVEDCEEISEDRYKSGGEGGRRLRIRPVVDAGGRTWSID